MDNEKIKQTIMELHRQLESEQEVDPELRGLLGDLDTDIHALFAASDSDNPLQSHGIMERAEALTARFAADHPHAEALMREVVAALAKMGV